MGPGKNTKKKKRQTPKANKNKDELEKGFVGQGEEAAAWLGGQGLQSREERGDAGVLGVHHLSATAREAGHTRSTALKNEDDTISTHFPRRQGACTEAVSRIATVHGKKAQCWWGCDGQ